MRRRPQRAANCPILASDGVAGGREQPRIDGGQLGGLEAELGGARPGDVGGQPGREEGARHALRDRPVEQPGRPRHRQQRRHRPTARGLAEDGDPVRVAAERGDVVAHPLERRDLVEQAAVGRRPLDVAEALEPDPVVEVTTTTPPRARVLPSYSGSPDMPKRVGAALDPHHHRQPAAEVGRPHVDRQPSSPLVAPGASMPNAPGLRRWRPELVASRTPSQACDRLRRAEPDGRRRVRDAAEDRELALGLAADDAAGDLDVDVHPAIVATVLGARQPFALRRSVTAVSVPSRGYDALRHDTRLLVELAHLHVPARP